MRVFSTFFKICKSYKSSFILYSAIFLSIALMISNQGNNNSITQFESTSIKVAIFDNDNSNLSKSLSKYIEASHNIIELENDIDVFRDKMYTREVEYVLIIEKGFETSLANQSDIDTNNNEYIKNYKLPSSISGQFMDVSINSFISTYIAFITTGNTPDEAYNNTLKTLKADTSVSISNKEVSDEVPPIHNFFTYIPYVFACIIPQCLAPIFMVFKEKEMKKRIECSCISQTRVNLELTAGSAVFSIGISIFYLIVSAILYKDDLLCIAGALRVANMFIYSFVCLSLSFLIANVVIGKNMITMFTNIFGLGSSFLCGVFVPRELLGDTVVTIGKFFPTYWYVDLEEALLNPDSASMKTIATDYTIQILFAIAILIIGMIVAKSRRTN